MPNRKQDKAVEQALFETAVGGVQPIRKAFKVKRVEYDPGTGRKTCEYEEIIHETDEVYHAPSPMAQRFWLQSRKPATWGGAQAPPEMPPGVIELPAPCPPDGP